MPGNLHSIWSRVLEPSVAQEMFEQVTSRNSMILKGRFEANVIWTTESNAFEIYSPKAWQYPRMPNMPLSSNWLFQNRCIVENNRIHIKRLFGIREFSVLEVESVDAWVSDSAFYEVLSLVLKSGAKQTIVRRRDFFNALEFSGTTPPWDSHELHWAGGAAKQIAKVLNVTWCYRDSDTGEMMKGTDSSFIKT